MSTSVLQASNVELVAAAPPASGGSLTIRRLLTCPNRLKPIIGIPPLSYV